MRNLKLLLFVLGISLCAYSNDAFGQTNLTGQTFSNTNILTTEFDDLESEKANKKKELIAAAEKKKGRSLSEKETAEIETKVAEAYEKAIAMNKSTSIGITIKFISATEFEMSTVINIDDETLKAAGLGWFKRKALKASLSLMPKSVKDKYARKENLIIVSPNNEPDTLRLSTDGLQLTGKFDEKIEYILQRQ